MVNILGLHFFSKPVYSKIYHITKISQFNEPVVTFVIIIVAHHDAFGRTPMLAASSSSGCAWC